MQHAACRTMAIHACMLCYYYELRHGVMYVVDQQELARIVGLSLRLRLGADVRVS
jgi:hypothetical protein